MRSAPWSDDELAAAAAGHERVGGRPLVGVGVALVVGIMAVGQVVQRSSIGVGWIVSVGLLVVAVGALVVRTRMGDVQPLRNGGTAFRVDPGLVWLTAFTVLIGVAAVAVPVVGIGVWAWRMGGPVAVDAHLVLTVVAATAAGTLLVVAASTTRLRVEVDLEAVRLVALTRTADLPWDAINRVTLVHERDAELTSIGRAVRWASRHLSRRLGRSDDVRDGYRVHAIATIDGRCHPLDEQWEMRGDVASTLALAVAAAAHVRGVELVTRLADDTAEISVGATPERVPA